MNVDRNTASNSADALERPDQDLIVSEQEEESSQYGGQATQTRKDQRVKPYRMDAGGPQSPGELKISSSSVSSAGTQSNDNEFQPQAASLAFSPSSHRHRQSYNSSPIASIRPFDRRFQARLSSAASRTSSAHRVNRLTSGLHSRSISLTHTIRSGNEVDVQNPWETVRWTKLKSLSSQVYAETGKRTYGTPTCIAVSSLILLGTSRGLVLIFDYSQSLKEVIGLGSKAIECGAVSCISISADHSSIATGHANGTIFTWEIAKPSKPFLQILPIDRGRNPRSDGHSVNAAVLHVGFLGIRHTALTSADDTGMAFSHLATRGMGMVARSVITTRILGRYPDTTNPSSLRKPSSVLACSPLPLGNVETRLDSIGLVAMLTPYLLVLVSTMPIAQTQYKSSRPKDITAHSALTGALAWFPSVKLKPTKQSNYEKSTNIKLAYSWYNVLTMIEVVTIEGSDDTKSEPANLEITQRGRWKAEESIVAIQWLGRSVLAVLTITQQLIILEDKSFEVKDSSDLMQRHIYQVDFFSSHLNDLVSHLEDSDVSDMHGVVADAFYMSFKAYKGRLFVLGNNDVSFGTFSNWADRLVALVESGDFLRAVSLATEYYIGSSDRATVGLPEDDNTRHNMVHAKLKELLIASLRYSFKKSSALETDMVSELADVAIVACIATHDLEFLFDEVYTWYKDNGEQSVILLQLDTFITNAQIRSLPPEIVKDLVNDFAARKWHSRLEETLCSLDPTSMDLDQITHLCRQYDLYDALLYVWSQAIGDYTSILSELLQRTTKPSNLEIENESHNGTARPPSMFIYPYLSYILTGRIYPTGEMIDDAQAILAKAELYSFFFSGKSLGKEMQGSTGLAASMNNGMGSKYHNLRLILDYDTPSFLSMLNEAFEDPFLNGSQLPADKDSVSSLSESQRFGRSMNRQWIITILLEVLSPPTYDAEDLVYLYIFIARNLPKFPQFLLLPGQVLEKVLRGLCLGSVEEVAEDCQLSVEYLLSVYSPPSLRSLMPDIQRAKFHRVLKSIYRNEQQYVAHLQACLDDTESSNDVYLCISQYLKKNSKLSDAQRNDFRAVLQDQARTLLDIDIEQTAKTLDKYAPDLHAFMLSRLEDRELDQLAYLRAILEPAPESSKSGDEGDQNVFIEQYIRLMCKYDASRVKLFIEGLSAGDLRLAEVAQALEEGQIIDAVVLLLVREGKVRQGSARLAEHLQTLSRSLVGVLAVIVDDGNPEISPMEIVALLRKYTRVGIWLCQKYTMSSRLSIATEQAARSLKSKPNSRRMSLTPDEEIWVELLGGLVMIINNISDLLPTELNTATSVLSDQIQLELRSIVQEVFTAVLNCTTEKSDTSDRTDASFLRILRGFLDKVSYTCPSLAGLRGVLRAIFDAYAYEEQLIRLSNRLLDTDLFTHVAEVDRRRRRGWHPQGQSCDGCNSRIWGPGAGDRVWQAWTARQQHRKSTHARITTALGRRYKGKHVEVEERPIDDTVDDNKQSERVALFACQHLFHIDCLATICQLADDDDEKENLFCPLCKS